MNERALVALSDDRQWMCSKIPDPFINFCIAERVWFNQHFGLNGRYIWEERQCIEDTGQDAHEVLREFLEGQYRYSVVDQSSLSVKAWRATREEAQAVVDAIRAVNPDMPEDELTIAEREAPDAPPAP
jgi:hypothetical protein